MKNTHILFVFVLVVLIPSTLYAMSQNIRGVCKEGFVRIAKLDENTNTPLMSCVTPNVAERFNELDWQIIPSDQNTLSVLFEKAKQCGEALTEEILQTDKCSANDKFCYLLQEPILKCLGKEVNTIAEEVVEDIKTVTEKVEEAIEGVEEEVSEERKELLKEQPAPHE